MLNEASFWARVNKGGPNGCWLWIGAMFGSGYGKVALEKRTFYAHRISYEFVKGPIPTHLELDHLCRVRNCVNPDHLEAVDHRTNVLRSPLGFGAKAAQTECIHGHPFDSENTIIKKNGTRACRACTKVWASESRRRRRVRLGAS